MTLNQELAAADGEELVNLLARFDVQFTFDKPSRSPDISAAIGLDPSGDDEPEKTTATRPNGDGSQVLSIAGAGFERISATAYRLTASRILVA